MHERTIGALPVVERGRVVGMLTERDVLRALQAMVRGHVERVRPMPTTAAEGAACDFGFAEPGGGEVWDNAGQGN